MIYHITPSNDWQAQSENDFYTHTSLQSEGFIHCSTAEQVAPVRERYFQGVTNLLLLHIDPKQLTAELKYEPSTGNELYPHIYGVINKTAIVKIEELQ